MADSDDPCDDVSGRDLSKWLYWNKKKIKKMHFRGLQMVVDILY